MINTRFQILVEVAARQPNVRQTDIADKLDITPQAVSEYIKQLLNEGHVSSEGPMNYRVTRGGVEEIIKGAQSIRAYSRFVLEDVVSDARVFTAIAVQRMRKGQKVGLWMEDGLLHAGEKPDSKSKGTVVRDAEAGQDVGVMGLTGVIELDTGAVTICMVPGIARGGSRSVDYEKLKKEIRGKKFICALGVEALITLRRINKSPVAMFGVRETVIEASHHGISPVVVGVDDEVPELIRRLDVEKIPFSIVDVSLLA